MNIQTSGGNMWIKLGNARISVSPQLQTGEIYYAVKQNGGLKYFVTLAQAMP